MSFFSKSIADFWAEEGGVASIEFVMAVPILIAVFSASFESGLFMTRKIMLEQSLDIVMRELRLGHYPAPVKTDTLKNEICKLTVVFENCQANLMMQFDTVSTTTFALPTTSTECRDLSKDLTPPLNPNPFKDNEVVLVRACIVVQALFPTTGIGLSLTRTASGGGVEIVAMSAFSNEPS